LAGQNNEQIKGVKMNQVGGTGAQKIQDDPKQNTMAKTKDLVPVVDDIMDKPQGQLNIRKALALRLENKLSYGKIAAILEAPKSTVHKALQPFLSLINNPPAIDAYIGHRAALLNSAEFKILRALVNDKVIKKASLNNLAYSYDKVTHARRLEEGESTENVAVITAAIQDLQANLRADPGLRDKLKARRKAEQEAELKEGEGA